MSDTGKKTGLHGHAKPSTPRKTGSKPSTPRSPRPSTPRTEAAKAKRKSVKAKSSKDEEKSHHRLVSKVKEKRKSASLKSPKTPSSASGKVKKKTKSGKVKKTRTKSGDGIKKRTKKVATKKSDKKADEESTHDSSESDSGHSDSDSDSESTSSSSMSLPGADTANPNLSPRLSRALRELTVNPDAKPKPTRLNRLAKRPSQLLLNARKKFENMVENEDSDDSSVTSPRSSSERTNYLSNHRRLAVINDEDDDEGSSASPSAKSSPRPASSTHRKRRTMPSTSPKPKNSPRLSLTVTGPDHPLHASLSVDDVFTEEELKQAGVSNKLRPHSAQARRNSASEAADKKHKTKGKKKKVEKGNIFPDSDKLKAERKNTRTEIISTEKTYLKEFEVLLREYLTPMKELDIYPKHSEGTLAKVITASHTILALHRNFLQDLEASTTLKQPGRELVKCIIEYVEYMKNYYAYVQVFPIVTRDLTTDLSKPLQKFLDSTTSKFGHQGISQLLILPVQRVPRYLLLLERLEKATPEMHRDILLIREAVKKIRVVAHHIDECQVQSESAAYLFEVERRLKNRPSDLTILCPTRCYCMSGQFMYVKDVEKKPKALQDYSSKHQLHIYLFNDIILIMDGKYNYKSHIELHLCTAKPYHDTVLALYAGADGTFMDTAFVLHNAQERDLWQKRIRKLSRAMEKELNEVRKRQKHMHKTAAAGRRSSTHSALGEMGELLPDIEQVNVFLRVRPFITKEEKKLNEECLEVDDNIAVLSYKEPSGDAQEEREKVVVFDEIFDATRNQADVYDRVGEEALGALFAGYPTAIFAYGNTGTGKTYTMFGEVDDDERKGLTPRILENLFEVLQSDDFEYAEVKVTFLQIYNDQIQDLQARKIDGTNLKIVKEGDFHKVAKAIETEVRTVGDAMDIVWKGNAKRSTRSHNMNDVSSRSHAIFMLSMKFKRKGDDSLIKSSLHIIDLAGSENAKDTGATGDALIESKYINQSLTCLGRVVNAIVENRTKHKRLPVPFRDSKLTWLLTDVLTGNFVCSLILNASSSPAHNQAHLTAMTMAFGSGVKRLTVQAKQQREEIGFKHWLKGVWKGVQRGAKGVFKE